MKRTALKFCSIFLVLFILIISQSSFNENNYKSKPEIFGIQPEKAFIGDEITIYGKNFRSKRGLSQVFFGEISCQNYDFDYIYWSDNIIKVKVPTGAKSNYIKLKIDGDSVTGPNIYLYYENSIVYSNPMDVTIDYTIKFQSFSEIDKPLFVWIPSAVPSDTQRNVKLVDKSTNHVQRQLDELDLYKISKLAANKEISVSKKFKYTSYQFESKINPETVTNDYDVESDFYKYYTTAQYGIESDNPRIQQLAKQIVRDEQNPYIKAKLIYDWVVDFMTYQFPPPNSDWRALSALDTARGDCAVYSFLFISLCHASGVPARPVAGHVIFNDDIVSMHFWAEFYVPRYGWLPVDANYGDIQISSSGFFNKDKYFANMDNRHIAFSKGRVVCRLPSDAAGRNKDTVLLYMQKFNTYIYDWNDAKKFNVDRIIKRVF